MLNVSNVMRRDPVTLDQDATLEQAIATLCECGISGVPVLDKDKQLAGIISEFALLDVLFDPELKQEPVADYMTRDVHTLKEEDSLTRAVQMIALYGVRRLPVVRDGEVVGVVSRQDLLSHAATLTTPLSDPLEDIIPHLA